MSFCKLFTSFFKNQVNIARYCWFQIKKKEEEEVEGANFSDLQVNILYIWWYFLQSNDSFHYPLKVMGFDVTHFSWAYLIFLCDPAIIFLEKEWMWVVSKRENHGNLKHCLIINYFVYATQSFDYTPFFLFQKFTNFLPLSLFICCYQSGNFHLKAG